MAEDAAVHVIDDDDAVRHSLAFLFESAGLAVRTYETAEIFLGVATRLTAGCVLTDVRMPGMDGLALQRRLLELEVPLPVIVMTGHGDRPVAIQALAAGAAAFIEKPFDDEVLLAAVRAALGAGPRASGPDGWDAGVAVRLSVLTPLERQVLQHLVAGRPTNAIARALGTSPHAVERHRAGVMEKMGVRSLAELLRLALRGAVAAGPGMVLDEARED
ncbi:response regulator transcription factor [Caldovatus aquaticus]|uniref:Response regulator n=1 Tax=Caldovatus aquaticus TaxID=2865671 RepID=A0ABS7F1K6_9PROT|nr:response regulator [Caldovatus aquaticus]MBW8269484.1 response regulator [Caldovatus aquaticus]